MRYIVLESFDGQCRYGSDKADTIRGGSKYVASLSKCNEECAATSTCVAFAYWDENYCVLYRNGPYTHGDSKKTVKCYQMKSGTLYAV